MHQVSLGAVKFAEGFDFAFPTTCCANCGTREALRQQPQDTRKSTYLLVGGTELTFKLPLTVCADCEPSLKRRPLTLANKVLIGLMVSAAIATGILIFADSGNLEMPFLADNLFLISLLAGGGLSALYFLRHRPQPRQSSYYQPVLIQRLNRRFLDGAIEGIVFAFTHPAYQEAFEQLNRAAVQAGFVKAVASSTGRVPSSA
ncbi:hypothetical protein DRW03_17695 [Corallococcus sp. H22C18031201]|nr:hypothetical protein DRW03_17695 [Corallococcus sp. H22C18031201]